MRADMSLIYPFRLSLGCAWGKGVVSFSGSDWSLDGEIGYRGLGSRVV